MKIQNLDDATAIRVLGTIVKHEFGTAPTSVIEEFVKKLLSWIPSGPFGK